jgi:hypothetical protein
MRRSLTALAEIIPATPAKYGPASKNYFLNRFPVSPPQQNGFRENVRPPGLRARDLWPLRSAPGVNRVQTDSEPARYIFGFRRVWQFGVGQWWLLLLLLLFDLHKFPLFRSL